VSLLNNLRILPAFLPPSFFYFTTIELAAATSSRDAPNPHESASSSLPRPEQAHEIAAAPTATVFTSQTHRPDLEDESYSLTAFLASFFTHLPAEVWGLVHSCPLPSFPGCSRAAMAASHYPIPGTPRVISPSPTPSEGGSRDGYFGPITRSLSRKTRVTSPPMISEDDTSGSDPDKRARARSRSPGGGSRRSKIKPLTSATATGDTANGTVVKRRKSEAKPAAIDANGHLSPPPRSYWRELSRSPSPLGLIPIHEQFRLFVSLPAHPAPPNTF
jgi:hypothetical protein